MVSGRGLSRVVLAGLFVGAGVLHLVRPEPFERIVPPGLPAPSLLVLVSGLAEILGGAGLLPARTRRAARWGLGALLLAVFPANVWMALDPVAAGVPEVPRWVLWARLPLQPLLMAWVWWAGGGRFPRGWRTS